MRARRRNLAGRARRGEWASVLVMLVMLSTRPARAAGDHEAIRLVYHAPEACPTKAEFEARLVRASPRLTIADDEDVSARRLTIDIDDRGRSARLAVASNDSSAPPGIRDVEGIDCHEVIDQLAFASSLALDFVASPPSPSSPAIPAAGRAHERTQLESSPRPSAWDHDEIAFGVSSGLFNDQYNGGVYASGDLLVRHGPVVIGGVGDACGSLQPYWGGGAAVGITAPLPSWLRVDLVAVLGAHSYSPGVESARTSAPSGVIGFAGGRLNASFEVSHLAVGASATAESDLARASSSSAVNTRFAWGPFVGGTFGL